jgi:hypothetical protein
MKAINYLLICGISALFFTANTPQAQAQSRPELCKIHSGNVHNFTSSYNLFNQSTATPLRPFIQNNVAYKVDNNLIAKPIFYTLIDGGNTVSAFEIKGKFGDIYVGKRDIAIQYIVQNQTGSYAELIGMCLNGTFATPKKRFVLNMYELVPDTQSALQEARSGASAERIGNMFR